MTLLAIDPGSEQSAWIELDGGRPVVFAISRNEDLLVHLREMPGTRVERVVLEMMAPRGMPTSKEEMRTLVWIGRFTEAVDPLPVDEVTRLKVKTTICGSAKANDANIRQALIDRYGATKDEAIGRKASQGPLYGIAGDVWAALALGLTWRELHP